jgi:CDP-diacylglycerol--glycerol-3-phosphate 3-phosphatidyltransferase
LSDQVLQRSLLDQFSAQHQVRLGLSFDRAELPVGENGIGFFAALSPAGFWFSHPQRGSTPKNISFQAMTSANKITICRILLVPFFIVQLLYYREDGEEWHRFWAIFTFAIVALADALDGYVARRYNQRSELGAILDPLADKTLLISAIVLLTLPPEHEHSYFTRIPLWLTGTIIGRDMILLTGIGVIRYMVGNVTVRPRVTGKLATVLQMAAVLWILFKWPSAGLPYFTISAAVFTGISGLLYVLDGVRQLNAHPSSAASPRQ